MRKIMLSLMLLSGAFMLSAQNPGNPTDPGFPGNLSGTDPGSISVPSHQNINNTPPQNVPGAYNPPAQSVPGYQNGNINNPDQNHLSGTTGATGNINNNAPGQNYPTGYTGTSGYYPNGAIPPSSPGNPTGPSGPTGKLH